MCFLHTPWNVCVCVSHVGEFCLHEVHCKLILYWQLLSGRWSHFCGRSHTVCVCVYVSICLSVPGRHLWYPLEAGLNSEQMCVGYRVSLRKSSPGMEAGLAGSQRQPFFILGELPLPPVLKFMQRQYSLIAVSHYQHILPKPITIC